MVNDTEVFGAMVAGVETVSHLITRYAIFEDLYISRNLYVGEEMSAALIELYAQVLTYLSTARKYFQTSTPSKWLRPDFSLNLFADISSACFEECFSVNKWHWDAEHFDSGRQNIRPS